VDLNAKIKGSQK